MSVENRYNAARKKIFADNPEALNQTISVE